MDTNYLGDLTSDVFFPTLQAPKTSASPLLDLPSEDLGPASKDGSVRSGSGGSGGSGNSTTANPCPKSTKPKRVRKPQKDRLMEVEERVASLQRELKAGEQKQQELLLQQAQLQSSAKPALDKDEEGPVAPGGMPNPDEMLYLLDVDGNMRHMKAIDIVNLSTAESIAVHEVYMDTLANMLARRQDESKDTEILRLTEQVCKATYIKGVYRPQSMREIITHNRDGLDDKGKVQLWSKTLRALNLSKQQIERALHFRRLFLPTQRQLLQTRQQLLINLKESQHAACRCDSDLMKQTSACRKMMRELQQNLHADQNVLNRLFNQMFREVLVGMQKPIILVESNPGPFDLVGLLNQLAAETGDTDTQGLLGWPSSAPQE
ncbi:hypothetical protein WJX84_009133 [Apatococcus fuscideae]|uniref:Uncharacterized protein n=1 Tax=Apatococcus fuscideae TaxID=2026836 RepID=A0AAW1STZ8_9CHLO